MNKSAESIKRQIRKLLTLAADGRGDKATAREALRLAKRLLKANGWTEDDVRGEDGWMPGDLHFRLTCKGDRNFERHLCASKITFSQYQKVMVSNRLSVTSGFATVDFRGPKQFVDPAQKLWVKLNTLLQQGWYANEQSNAVNQHIGSLGFGQDIPAADEPSWLQGVLEGFLSVMQQEERWKSFKELQERVKNAPKLPAPKKVRSRRVKHNPLWPAPIYLFPKPKPEPIIEAEIVEEVDEKPIEAPAAEETKPESNGKASHLDRYSFRSGIRFGTQLFQRIEQLTKE